MGFAILSGLAVLAIFPCSWLPAYKPGDISGGASANERRGEYEPIGGPPGSVQFTQSALRKTPPFWTSPSSMKK